MLAKLSLYFLLHLRNNSTVNWKLKHIKLIQSNLWEFKLTQAWPENKPLLLPKLRHILDKKLWSQFTMQYLKNIYAMFLGIKRCFSQKISYITKKNSSGCSFKLEISTRVLYLITPLFLSPLMRLLLKTAFLLANAICFE